MIKFITKVRDNKNSLLLMIPVFTCHLIDLLFRTINLDERFLLNAGRIILQYKDFVPQHLTWSTLLGGSLLTFTKLDYFFIFFGMRLFMLLLVYGAVIQFGRSINVSGLKAALIFFLVSLIHPDFLDYLIQPRYDTFVFVFLVMFFSLFQTRKELSWGAAVLLFLMTFSGLKGVYYSLIPVSVIALNWSRSEYRLSQLIQFGIKFIGIWAILLVGLSLGDLLGPLFNTYQMHAFATLKTQRSFNNFFILGMEYRQGLLFYFICLSFLYFYLRDSFFQKVRSASYLALMILSAILYCFIHPRIHFPMLHPMHLALVMIGIVVLLKSELAYLRKIVSTNVFLTLFSIVFLMQMISNPYFSLTPVKLEFFYTGLARDVQNSKNLDQMIPEGATVYDPTSFILSRKPCVKEWYLDRLYNDLRVQGLWQKDLDLKVCDFVYMRESSHYLGYEQVIQLFENFENVGGYFYRNKAYRYPWQEK